MAKRSISITVDSEAYEIVKSKTDNVSLLISNFLKKQANMAEPEIPTCSICSEEGFTFKINNSKGKICDSCFLSLSYNSTKALEILGLRGNE